MVEFKRQHDRGNVVMLLEPVVECFFAVRATAIYSNNSIMNALFHRGKTHIYA